MSSQTQGMKRGADSLTGTSTDKAAQLSTVIADIGADRRIIHVVKKGDKRYDPKISPIGQLSRSFVFETPPLIADWPKLSANGNLGSQFAQEEKDASFEVNLSTGDAEQLHALVGANATILLEKNEQFMLALENMFKDLEDVIFENDNILKKKKKALFALAKKQLARVDGVDVKTITNDDKRVEENARLLFDQNANAFVKRDKASAFFRAKKRVFRRDFNSESEEDKNTPIPIFDVHGTRLNGVTSEENQEVLVNGGDLISARISLRPYIIPSGAYGISADLISITKIKEGGRSVRSKTSSHSFADWAS